MSWSFDGSSGYLGAITSLPGRVGTCTALTFRSDNLAAGAYGDGTVQTICSYYFDADNFTKLFVRMESGVARMYLADNNGGTYQEAGSVKLEEGVWYRVVFLHDDNEGQWEYYVDGELIGSITTDGSTDQSFMVFGNDTVFGSEILDGWVDNVQVYASKNQFLYLAYGYERFPNFVDPTGSSSDPVFHYQPGQGFDIAYAVLDWNKNQDLTVVGSVTLAEDPWFLQWNSKVPQTVIKPSSRALALNPAVAKFGISGTPIALASPALTVGAVTLSLTPAVIKAVAASPAISASASVALDPAQFKAAAAAPDLEPGTVSLGMTPAVARFQAPDLDLSNPATIDLDPAPFRALAAAPAIEPGASTLALDPATARMAAAQPALISGSTTITLAPAVMSAVAQGFDIDSGAQTLSLTPAVMRTAATALDITPGTILLFMQAARAKFVAPNQALSQGLSLDVAIARIEAVAPAISAPATIMLEPAVGSLLAVAPALVGATNETLSLLPAVATFIVPFPGQRTNMFLPPVQIRILAPTQRIIGVVSLKDRITCALLESAREGEFYIVERNPNTGCTSTGLSVRADHIEALTNEIFADFDTARRHRRTFKDERMTWTWQLILGFNREVNLTQFERSLTERPRVIPRDVSLGFPQVTLRLRESVYDHPVQQEGSQGTRAVLTFRADVAPV